MAFMRHSNDVVLRSQAEDSGVRKISEYEHPTRLLWTLGSFFESWAIAIHSHTYEYAGDSQSTTAVPKTRKPHAVWRGGTVTAVLPAYKVVE